MDRVLSKVYILSPSSTATEILLILKDPTVYTTEKNKFNFKINYALNNIRIFYTQ